MFCTVRWMLLSFTFLIVLSVFRTPSEDFFLNFYLFLSSKYRYNEAYTIWNNDLEQQGWLTSTNNCPSHTHAYTHSQIQDVVSALFVTPYKIDCCSSQLHCDLVWFYVSTCIYFISFVCFPFLNVFLYMSWCAFTGGVRGHMVLLSWIDK